MSRIGNKVYDSAGVVAHVSHQTSGNGPHRRIGNPVEGTQSPGACFLTISRSWANHVCRRHRIPARPHRTRVTSAMTTRPRKDGQEPPYHPEASGKPPPVGSRPGYPMPLTSPSASGPRKDASEVIMGGRGQIRKENAKLSGKTRTSPSWKQPGWSPGPWRRVKAPEAPPGPARHPGQPPAWVRHPGSCTGAPLPGGRPVRIRRRGLPGRPGRSRSATDRQVCHTGRIGQDSYRSLDQ